jgi:Domain of unknown function (DUF4407)
LARHTVGSRMEPTQGAGLRQLIGSRLRILTGVDERLLAKVSSERARYTALGGVVLGTATIAAFSMWMALSEVLGGFKIFIIVPVLIWGLFVLNLDRWLISSSAGSQWHRRAAILLPRLLLAGFFGIVIAEPLVLRIFETAIEQHIRTTRQDELTNLTSVLVRCNPEPSASEHDRAAAATDECTDYHISFAATALGAAEELATKQRDADKLEDTIRQDTRQQENLDELARNECAGTRGPGLTGKAGRGPECVRREREADDFRRSHRTEEKVKDLEHLREEIDKLQSTVNAAQNTYQGALDAEVEKRVAERRSHHGPIGLLERFKALQDLVSANGFLTAASWCIRLLFIVVDCLPVLVKFFGGTTAYDRLVDRQLASAERMHREEIRTAELAVTTDLEVEQHKVMTDADQRRAEIDLGAREHEAGINVRIAEATNSLTERLITQRRADFTGNGGMPTGHLANSVTPDGVPRPS